MKNDDDVELAHTQPLDTYFRDAKPARGDPWSGNRIEELEYRKAQREAKRLTSSTRTSGRFARPQRKTKTRKT